jgi:hypothetical protein
LPVMIERSASSLLDYPQKHGNVDYGQIVKVYGSEAKRITGATARRNS